MRELGIVSKDHPVSPRFPGVPAWDTLPAEQKKLQAYRMAAHAGMIEHMDYHVGRLVRHLKKTGASENTIIIYLNDDGPDFSQPNLGDPA